MRVRTISALYNGLADYAGSDHTDIYPQIGNANRQRPLDPLLRRRQVESQLHLHAELQTRLPGHRPETPAYFHTRSLPR